MARMYRDLIYDVGMHDGSDTAYYLHRGFRVIGIEADAATAAICERRFASEISAERLVILNIAIAEKDGTMPFYIFEGSSHLNSFCPPTECRNLPHRVVEMPCRTFGAVLERHGVPIYLKTDIEGKDGCCIDALTNDLPQFVSFERYDDALFLSSLATLHGLGYDRFKLINQHSFLPIEWPPTREAKEHDLWFRAAKSAGIPARAARKIVGPMIKRKLERTRIRNGWHFPLGSSGPFGDDLPGEWKRYDQICEIISRTEQVWSDCHARLAGG